MVHLEVLTLIRTKGVNLCARPIPFRKALKVDASFEKITYVPVMAKKGPILS